MGGSGGGLIVLYLFKNFTQIWGVFMQNKGHLGEVAGVDFWIGKFWGAPIGGGVKNKSFR